MLLDSGDAVGDTVIASETKGSAIVHLMNGIGYDGIAIGNHEPDFGVENLRSLMDQPRFPFLATNIKIPVLGIRIIQRLVEPSVTTFNGFEIRARLSGRMVMELFRNGAHDRAPQSLLSRTTTAPWPI